LVTIASNFVLGNVICNAQASRQRLLLSTGIAINLALLAYFKYFGFILNDVLQLNHPTEALPPLPLGISFFIFQSISYLIDIYRGDAQKARSFTDLALYISMFPQLVAGPIVRYNSVDSALRQRTIDLQKIQLGASLFIAGLCQKVLIANNAAEIADQVYGMNPEQLDIISAWGGALTYTLQIYFDFCGYSLMAIGLGYAMGFQFPANFNYPYISRSITEFWRRWHMSLSSWFRDYLYIPLGGNRKGTFRTYCNLFIVFFLCGLWHGASWTFVAWGCFHGGLLVIERMGLKDLLARLPAPLSLIYTLLLVVIGWVLFRAESFAQAQAMLSAMFGGAPQPANLQFLDNISNENLFFCFAGAILSAPVIPWLKAQLSDQIQHSRLYRLSATGVLLGLFFMCTLYTMANTYNPFIYFRF